MNLTEQLERLNALYTANAITADEYAKAKAKLLSDEPASNAQSSFANTVFNGLTKPGTSQANKLGRNQYDRWFGGVCGGLAASTDMPSWAWRVLFVMLALLHGLGILLYILLWIFMPLASTALMAKPAAAQATAQAPAPSPVPSPSQAVSPTPPPVPFSDTPPQS